MAKLAARAARASLPHSRLCLLRPGWRHDVLRSAGGAVLRAPGQHTYGRGYASPDRRLASGAAAPHPVSEYCGALVEQPDDGAGAAAHLQRIRRAGGVAGPGPASAQAHFTLDRRHARLGFVVPRGPDGGLEATHSAGLRLRPLVDSGKLLLLRDYRVARRAPG